jgi:hypothetical protein
LVSKDDRPAGGSRPSLLSTEQEGAADGRSVLGALDGKGAKPAKATKPAKPAGQPKPAARPAVGQRKPGRSLALLGALGAGVIALAGGTLAWMANVPDDESVAAVTAPPAAAQAPASAPAPAARMAASPSSAAQSDVSTAAILQDTASAPPEKQPSLKEMLAAPSAKAVARPDPLTQALERPSKKDADARKPEQVKTQPQEPVKTEAKKKPAKDKPAREKPKAAPAPKQPPQDKDATVLAALMAHVQPNSQIP